MVYKLVHNNHPALYTISKEVPIDEDVNYLVREMNRLMVQGNGVGLAANQIGITKRVIVIHTNGFIQEFINPIITKFYGRKITSHEGCLSYPGLKVPVIRYTRILVEGYDMYWRPIKRKLKMLNAYCVQHEVDHLNGITIGKSK